MMQVNIPDNQNRYTGGYKYSCKNKKKIESLEKLSALSVWDLQESNSVLLLSSFGIKNDNNKDRKFIEVGAYDENDKSITIYTENVMGFLSYEGVDVNIYSRFDRCGHFKNEGDTEEQEIKNPYNFFLFHMLSKVCGVTMANLMASTSHESVLDLYPLFFPKLLKEAVHQGLYRAYRQHDYNDMRVKGRIDVSRHIRQNTPFRGTIAYSSREYDADNVVTQLIRHTIEYLKTQPMGRQSLSCDQDTRAAVELIVQATPSYDQKQFLSVLQKNISKKVNHPYYNKYILLQQLCIAILQKKKASYGENGKQKIQGVLFDGAWLWEEYVACLLKEKFTHYTDYNSHFKLFDKEDSNKFQKIIPDYLSNDGDDENGYNAVADAKYIYLHGDKLSAERASAVYYKTIMYMYRFGADTGFLFHPIPSNSEEEPIKELNIEGNRNGKLIIAGLKIPSYTTPEKNDKNRTKAFSDFQEKMEKAEKEYVVLIDKKLNS